MKIDTIRDLEKIIRICRKTGVDIIKIGDIEIVLGKATAPTRIKRPSTTKPLPGINEDTPIDIPDAIESDELTEDQLMFGSSDPQVWSKSQ